MILWQTITNSTIGIFDLKFILIAILLFPFSVCASMIQRTLNNNLNSIVKITIHKHGEKAKWGTGFIVSRDGYVLTAQHVIKDWLESSSGKWNIEILTSDGKIHNYFKLLKCDNSKSKIDIFLIKINYL